MRHYDHYLCYTKKGSDHSKSRISDINTFLGRGVAVSLIKITSYGVLVLVLMLCPNNDVVRAFVTIVYTNTRETSVYFFIATNLAEQTRVDNECKV